MLPLAEGYTTMCRNFDPQTQKVRTIQLVVGGTESVTVPAGTFEAFKVDITSSAGHSITEWVAKDSPSAYTWTGLKRRMTVNAAMRKRNSAQTN
jgi:hypothetical protein